MLQVADVIQQHVDLDIAQMLIAYDDRHKHFIRLLGENGTSAATLRRSADPLLKFVQLAHLAYLGRIGDRYRHVEIRRGAVNKVPSIRDKFTSADVPGLDGFSTHAIRFSVLYSTLNNRDTPTHGNYVRLSIEPTIKELGGASNYRNYDAEIKSYIPLDNARYISVIRFRYNQTLNDRTRDDVPFLEQSILGGENTLRGYGRNRFIDNSFVLLNLEERIRLFRWEIFDVTADWEIAPFIDLGAVMKAFDKLNTRNFEYNPGIGFRAIVRPNIVGRVDLGVGRDGPAIFVGLGYPF